ncbi:DMT family transporter [Pimelobacter simplex]|uniref:DMT family transporter n=1 Tax=Nocardioides simplex TaxID=2045 RepID=UPI003AAA8BC3
MIAVALVSACLFAIGNATQHRAATDFGSHDIGAGPLLIRLARSPLWLAGSVVGLTAYVLHAVALLLGNIATVQPLMIVGVVLAVPLRAAIGRRRPRRGELLAVGVTSLGLWLFTISTSAALPAAGGAALSSAAATACAVGVGIATSVFLVSRRLLGHLHFAAMGYGATAGILFGTSGGLLKATMTSLDERGLLATAMSWGPWVVIVVSLAATTLNQKAYQMAPIVYSMPILNIASVMVAISFGVWALGEVPTTSLAAGAVQVGALVLIAAGLLRTARLEPAPSTAARWNGCNARERPAKKKPPPVAARGAPLRRVRTAGVIGGRVLERMASRSTEGWSIAAIAMHLAGATFALSFGYAAAVGSERSRVDALFGIACVAACVAGGVLLAGSCWSMASARGSPTAAGPFAEPAPSGKSQT